jgi:hypothetical protein
MAFIDVKDLSGQRKLWRVEEIPQNMSGKNIEGR